METKTVSTMITPTPTWQTLTVTLPPSPTPATLKPLQVFQHQPQPLTPLRFPSLWPQVTSLPRKVDPKTGLEYADVLEIKKETTPVAAKDKLDRLKQAYGILYANRAKINRFNNNSQKNKPVRNPIFDDDSEDDGELDEYDQQVLPAEIKAISVAKTAASATSEPAKATQRVFTLFFSGKSPGEYTTRLTTLLPGEEAPTNSRNKREAILPTPVRPLEIEVTPEVDFADLGRDSGFIDCLTASPESVEASFVSLVTKTVTVTEYLP